MIITEIRILRLTFQMKSIQIYGIEQIIMVTVIYIQFIKRLLIIFLNSGIILKTLTHNC